MRLEILGSGGAVTTPKPFCSCDVCTIARNGSSKDSRFGPSVFVHGPDILIDTPEEIFIQLNRSKVHTISACFYSHWHPDHTAGRRVFEMNKDWVHFPAKNRTTNVILTEKIAETFSTSLGLKSHLDFLENNGLINLEVIGNSEPYAIHGYTIKPVQLGQDYSFGYDIAGSDGRILIIMDELKFWAPGKEVLETRYDLIYLPLGIVDVNPITNARTIDPDHSILEEEQTYLETLEYVKQLRSKRFILGHVEEPDGVSFEMGVKLGSYCSKVTRKNVSIAFDMMECEV